MHSTYVKTTDDLPSFRELLRTNDVQMVAGAMVFQFGKTTVWKWLLRDQVQKPNTETYIVAFQQGG